MGARVLISETWYKAYTTNLTLEELRSGPSELDGQPITDFDLAKDGKRKVT